MKKYLKILLICILIICVFILYYKRIALKERFFNFEKKKQLPIEITKDKLTLSGADLVENNNIVNNNVETLHPTSLSENNIINNNNIISNPPQEIKNEINLKIHFTIQSPDQKWEGIYKEACEEASVLMIYGFLKNQNITVDFAMNQIADMVSWENSNLTISQDLTADQTLQLAKGFYKLSGEVVKLNSINDIKRIVSNGSPVILPALGRELKNPNFKTPGPLYHMLVVKGYTKDGLIITNDPGTRKGKDYLYNPDILFNAIADWDIQLGSPNKNKKVGILLID